MCPFPAPYVSRVKTGERVPLSCLEKVPGAFWSFDSPFILRFLLFGRMRAGPTRLPPVWLASVFSPGLINRVDHFHSSRVLTNKHKSHTNKVFNKTFYFHQRFLDGAGCYGSNVMVSRMGKQETESPYV